MSTFPTTDQEQLEVIKKWWKENGTLTVTVIVLAIVLSIGWRYWHQYKIQKAQQGSILYEQMLASLAQAKTDDFKSFASELEKNYRSTPYASDAALFEAQQAVKQNDLNLAESKLQWAIDHSHNDAQKEMIRMRMARILIAQGKAKNALSILEDIKNNDYATEANLIRGDAYVVLNQATNARIAYQAALHSLPENIGMRALVQMKLDQLSVNGRTVIQPSQSSK